MSKETVIKIDYPEHGKIVLTNSNGDTYTSTSEGLMDFFHTLAASTPVNSEDWIPNYNSPEYLQRLKDLNKSVDPSKQEVNAVVERPQIVNYFPKDCGLEYAIEVYQKAPELYNYMGDLDRYIDLLLDHYTSTEIKQEQEQGEEDIIGDIKNEFRRADLQGQRKVMFSIAKILGAISLAFYRGKQLSTPLPASQTGVLNEQMLSALKGLVSDVKNKPNDTRYATHIKIAEDAINAASQFKAPSPSTEQERMHTDLETLWRDIDLITDLADFNDAQKYKMIKEKIDSFNKTVKV